MSADGSTIAVATLLGVGATTARVGGLTSGNALAVRGSVNVIAVPNESQLAAYSTSVAENNRLHLATGGAGPAPLVVRANAPARAVPERPGERSLIDHVVFIIRENRTYDQVLSDIPRGARDSSLLMYGRDVTPNAHALAERYVLLDHFFATGGNSADGHHWLTQANETDYPMWPLYFGRSYPSESDDPLAYSAGGFLWESAKAKGRTVSVFGEFAPPPSDSVPAVRRTFLEQYRNRASHDAAFFRSRLKQMYNTRSPVPSLDAVLERTEQSLLQLIFQSDHSERVPEGHGQATTAAPKSPGQSRDDYGLYGYDGPLFRHVDNVESEKVFEAEVRLWSEAARRGNFKPQ